MICERKSCNNEVKGKGRGPYKKRFCSARCRHNSSRCRWAKKYPDKAQKWNRTHPKRFRISMIKSYLKALTKEELAEVLEGYNG